MKKKKKTSLKKRLEKQEKKRVFNLDPETKRGIVSIILFTLGILLILALEGTAGRFGELFNTYARLLFGQGTLLLPFIFIIAGFIILKFIHRNVYLPVAVGSTIFILGFLSILTTLFPEDREGGYLGYLFSWPFIYALGKWAAFIVFLAVILISILIAFNIPLRKPKKTKEKLAVPGLSDEWEEFPLEKIEKKKSPIFKKLFPRPKFKTKTLTQEKTKEVKPSFQEELLSPAISISSDYKFPPLDLLEEDKGAPSSGDIRLNADIIRRTLESGVKLSKITALQKDLSLALAAHPIRIEAPIPGRSLVGIEVPNKAVTLVRLRSLLEGIDLRKDLSRLNIVLGRDVTGSPVWSDLAKMPHLLIAGATGSGKSICINSLIINLLYQKTPEELKFILIDPKRVELPRYNDIPHLLTPVIVDLNKAINALKWAVGEMERRYELLSEVKARDIFAYNNLVLKGKESQILPFIVIIIDELADIMAAHGKEVEGAIIRLAQMSRAVGIHLVVSTQRPSVEVITGLIRER